MATTSGSYIGTGQIQWTISGLDYAASAYSQFRISTSDGHGVTWSDGTTYDYTAGHSCGTTVTGYGYATFNGTEYSCGSGSTYTEDCVAPPDTTAPDMVVAYTTHPTSLDITWNCTASDFYSCEFRLDGVLRLTSYVTNGTQTITGLTSGHTYTLDASVRDITGNWRYYTYYPTLPVGPPPDPPTNFQSTVIDANARTYSISYTASPGATSYEIDAYNNGTRAIKYQGSSTTATISLDQAGTTYTIEVYAKNANGTSSALIGYITTTGTPPSSGSGTPVTPPPGNAVTEAPTGLSVFKQNSNTVYPLDYYVSFNGTGNANYRILVKKSSDTQWYEKYNGPWANPIINFDAAGTSYDVRVYACNSSTDNNSCSLPATITFITAGASPRPSNWQWDTAKTAGQNFNLTATEWNNFTDRINLFRSYYDSKAGATIGQYSFTTAPYDASRDFYGWMYNQAVSAINQMNPPTPIPAETAASKAAGNIVKADFLNNLQTSLNSIS